MALGGEELKSGLKISSLKYQGRALHRLSRAYTTSPDVHLISFSAWYIISPCYEKENAEASTSGSAAPSSC